VTTGFAAAAIVVVVVTATVVVGAAVVVVVTALPPTVTHLRLLEIAHTSFLPETVTILPAFVHFAPSLFSASTCDPERPIKDKTIAGARIFLKVVECIKKGYIT
jgi:hypothetical protein